MKRTFFIAGLFLMLLSCKKVEQKRSVIAGTFSNQLFQNELLKGFDKKCQIDIWGNKFSIHIPDSNYQNYYSLNNNIEVFLLPGDSIFIQEVNGDYTFSGGESANISNRLKKIKKEQLQVLSAIDINKTFLLKPDSFLMVVNDLNNNLVKSIEDTIDPDLNASFSRLEKAKVKYRIYKILNLYAINHNDNIRNSKKTEGAFYEYLADADFQDTTLLQLKDYLKFLETTIDLKLRQNCFKSETDKYQRVNLMIDEIEKLNPSAKIKDEMIWFLMKGQIYKLNVNDSIMDRLHLVCKNEDYLLKLGDMYRTYKKVMPGMPASDFRFIDQKGKVYTLADFRGSYLYMDIWGLFCAPCLKAMPAYNNIKNKFKNKNIAFIGVCRELPKNKERWIRLMAKYNVTGLQFLPENESQFIADYLIGEIPRYILIDKGGRFLTANAPEPSEKLEEFLLQIEDINLK